MDRIYISPHSKTYGSGKGQAKCGLHLIDDFTVGVNINRLGLEGVYREMYI